jgi:WD40 repeat protein
MDLSPDGRWLAADCLGLGIRIWDVAGNRPLEPLPARMAEGGGGVAGFSPDGRWLVVSRQQDRGIWRVGHWEEEPRTLPKDNSGVLVGPLAFTPDGRLLAIARTPVEIQLIDLATFQEVARLQAPDARFIIRLRFNPDGSRLAAATENRVIQLWDLRAIRRELSGMDLDWDLPA